MYQLNSLRAFGIPYNKHLNGSFTIRQEFETEEEAKKHLEQRAIQYNDQDPEGTDEKLKEMLEGVKRGYLRLDAVMAQIDPLTDEE